MHVCRAADGKQSLLLINAKTKATTAEKAEPLKQLDEEQDILKHITMKTALKSVKELAKVILQLHSPHRSSAAQPGEGEV